MCFPILARHKPNRFNTALLLLSEPNIRKNTIFNYARNVTFTQFTHAALHELCEVVVAGIATFWTFTRVIVEDYEAWFGAANCAPSSQMSASQSLPPELANICFLDKRVSRVAGEDILP